MAPSTQKRSFTGESHNSDSTNKAAKSHERSSPSKATPTQGYETLNYRLRSCLRSPLALPLISLLTDGDVPASPDADCPLLKKYHNDKDRFDNAKSCGEEAFRKALEYWDGKSETKFTDEILRPELDLALNNILSADTKTSDSQEMETQQTQDSLPVKASEQTYIVGMNDSGRQKGFTDSLLWERSSTSRTLAHPISLMEIGIKGKYDWWQKIGQGLDYVMLMRNGETHGGAKDRDIEKYVFDTSNPMLLSSIIIGKQNGCVECDFGIFLCVAISPSNDSKEGDFRVILLWRQRTEGLKAAARAFGKVMQASMALHKWRREAVGSSFKYLGPNCAKINERVSLFWFT